MAILWYFQATVHAIALTIACGHWIAYRPDKHAPEDAAVIFGAIILIAWAAKP